MGPTGSGKSNFINVAARRDGHTVGHGLESQTSDIRTVPENSSTSGQSVVLVETPGFDDSSKSDEEILTMIADWLMKTYKGQLNLATIIYLHRIVDIQMSGSLQKNLKMFKSLCGQEAMPNIVIATTMWRRVWGTEGEEREARLKSKYWADMIAQGCRVERFQDTYKSAWHIIGHLKQDMTSNEKDQRAQGVENRAAQLKVRLSSSANKERRGIVGFFMKFFGVKSISRVDEGAVVSIAHAR
ncbi:hypothetical protein PILCRDRAFT_317843 [Piloderma croceum F 1598]|uniref:G domain-containing protein n=1 Tax=Piloderma croceum (strain F 1598) TaxID=765440 RepID=A0A0C3FS40_PILCF|nr:hypothetical protein PILCRDRAFT_317843 [Piloderma croceum F 1598]